MESKERILRTIAHRETDRLPMDITYTSDKNLERLRLFTNTSSNESMFRTLGLDMWRIAAPLEYFGEQRYFNGEKADFWGVVPDVYEGSADSSKCPLNGVNSLDQIHSYKWPKINDFDGSRLAGVIDEHSDFAVIGGVWAPIFHNTAWLCGLEDTYANLLLEPELFSAVIEHVTDFWVAYTKKTLEAGKGRIDIVENCNCFGGQKDMMISPDIFRAYIKPSMKRLYDTIKGYDVKVMQHSCGAIEPIISDFIELGADILNPIQVSAAGMEPNELKRKYGKHLTFCGGIDTQKVLPFGTQEEVREEVRRIAGMLGEGGGYILAGSQALEDDIPIDNIIAMFDEGKSYIRKE